MKCYQHRINDAVGVCKSCGKAVCPDCAVDLGFAITCPGACEETARAYHKRHTHSIAVYQEQRKMRYIAPSFCTVLGILHLVYGYVENCPLNSFTVISGLFFLVFGLVIFFIQGRMMNRIKT
jgi:hypothetical protein